jgi:hypothetical protein
LASWSVLWVLSCVVRLLSNFPFPRTVINYLRFSLLQGPTLERSLRRRNRRREGVFEEVLHAIAGFPLG